MRCGLRREMLARAEADLERDRVDWAIEDRSGGQRSGRRERDAEARETPLPQRLLTRPQLAATAAAIDEALRARLGVGAQKARRSSSTRSSRSHEKPPSGSGARPKWP